MSIQYESILHVWPKQIEPALIFSLALPDQAKTIGLRLWMTVDLSPPSLFLNVTLRHVKQASSGLLLKGFALFSQNLSLFCVPHDDFYRRQNAICHFA